MSASPKRFRPVRLGMLCMAAALCACGQAPVPVAPEAPQAAVIAVPDQGPDTTSPEPARPELMVPAETTGYRAPPGTRARYQQEMRTEPDLARWASALATQARAGEVDAAVALADVHAWCSRVLRNPTPAPRPQPAGKPPAKPDQVPPSPCAGFGAPGALTAFNLEAAERSWRHTAARLGDPVSRLRQPPVLRNRLHEVSDEELDQRAAVEELLRAREYKELLGLEVLYRTTRLFGSNVPSATGQAWSRALCARLPDCAADDRSCRLHDPCHPTTIAAGLVRLTPRERRIVAGLQAHFQRALADGDLSPLWRQPPERP